MTNTLQQEICTMSKESSKDQDGKAPPNTAAPSGESAELQAALAQLTSILEKATLPQAKDGEGSSRKPAD